LVGAGLLIGEDHLAQVFGIELFSERGGATRSQNITVSWRRSASGVATWGFVGVGRTLGRGARAGVFAPFPLRLWAGADFLSAVRVAPQSPQNLAVGRTCWPQLGQTRRS